MVGVVLVSHSKALALATCALAKQAASEARVVGVGGTGDDGKEFGTDATAIMEAITQVDSEDGVLVLMDMGSALLSAETALDFLGEEVASHVHLCSAPLVEGGIIAAVQSVIGADMETVKQEAFSALEPKSEQLGEVVESRVPPSGQAVSFPLDALSETFIIRNQHGLHARPAATLVQTASKFDAEIYLSVKNSVKQPASARSLNSIVTLNLRRGDAVIVHTWGREAREFLDEMSILVLREFNEREVSAEELEVLRNADSADKSVVNKENQTSPRLVSISRGLAMGNVWKIDSTVEPIFHDEAVTSAEEESAQLNDLLDRAQKTLMTEMNSRGEGEAKSVLQMHQVMMQDPDLLRRSKEGISKGSSAERAWWTACMNVADEYGAIEDNELLRARADDVVDIGIRLLHESDSVTVSTIADPPEDAILFIDEISPGIITKFDSRQVKGIVTRTGGSTSHAAIIARSEGIPMVSGCEDMDAIPSQAIVFLDANLPEIVLNPDAEMAAACRKKMKDLVILKEEFTAQAQEMAHTRDGIRIECTANIGSRRDMDASTINCTDGIGLFRSEFLFLDRLSPPGEEEQYEAYSHVVRAMKGRDVIIRILDIGGDKSIPYLPLTREANPFLGLRGIRFVFQHEQILHVQLRALFRAALHGSLKIMLPMVVDRQEVMLFKEKMEDVRQELEEEKTACARHIPLGVMIETPASVMLIQDFAVESDFFSIGTNDLVQYVLAAERGNAALADLYDVCHPAMLHTLKRVSEAALASDTALSVCGEAAADFEVIPILLGMGIRKFSASASRIPALKHLIRSLSIKECQVFVQDVLKIEGAASVRKAVRERFAEVQRLAAVI